MNFGQLLEGNCGQVNPLVQLASQMTQDQAGQMNNNEPFTSDQIMQEYKNEYWNTFNMNELVGEVQTIETQSSMVSPTSSWANVEYKNEVYNSFCPQEAEAIHLQQGPSNRVPEYFPPGAEYLQHNLEMSNRFSHEFHSLPEHTPLDDEEYQSLQKEIAEAKKIFNSLEEEQTIREEHLEIQESVIEGSNDVAKIPSHLFHAHLSVEDVYGINELGMKFNDTENFYNFVKSYVLRHSMNNYQNYHPKNPNLTMEGILALHYDPDAKIKAPRLAKRDTVMTFYDMPFHTNISGSGNRCQDLAEELSKNEQYFDAIQFIQRDSNKFTSKHDEYVFLLTDAYLHEYCLYQACQTLFTWLKSKHEYSYIIPPNFVMEDKTETTLDMETLQAVTKMFIKAAQRSPVKPDPNVQIALSKLCELGQDYEKSIDCYTTIMPNTSGWKDRMWMSVGNSLALSNRYKKALDAFGHTAVGKDIQARTNRGLIYLKTGYYNKSTEYLYEIVKDLLIQGYEDVDVLLDNAWSRLRLCFQLMNRSDLCEAVDSRDQITIMKHISTLKN